MSWQINRRDTPGASRCGFGVLLLVSAVFWGVMNAQNEATWEHRQEHGRTVPVVVVDKRVVEGDRSRDRSDSTTYHICLEPSGQQSSAELELWRRTAEESRFMHDAAQPQRLWLAVESFTFPVFEVGQLRTVFIDGRRCLLREPQSGPVGGHLLTALLGAAGLMTILSGARLMITTRRDQERRQRKRRERRDKMLPRKGEV